MRRFVFLFFLALALTACLESPASTPTPSPTATPSLALPSPSPTPRIPYIPSAKPSQLPSATPTPVVNTSIPSLFEAAIRLEPIFNNVFNVTRIARGKNTTFSLIDRDVYSMGAVEGPYTYAVTFSHARTRWQQEELLETAQNASGTRNGFVSYSVGDADKANVMKCYGQRYELNLNLKGYDRNWFVADYQPLMRIIMGRLVDACPP